MRCYASLKRAISFAICALVFFVNLALSSSGSGDCTSELQTTSCDSNLTSSNVAVAVVGAVVGILVLAVSVAAGVLVVFTLWKKHITREYKFAIENQCTLHYAKGGEEEEKVIDIPRTSVLTLPTIEEFPKDMTVEEGHRVYCKILVTGRPTPSCMWYHDGNLIEDDYAHEINKDGSLVLFTVEPIHKGMYKMVAKNSVGIAEREFSLHVMTDEEAAKAAVLASPEELDEDLLEPISMYEFGKLIANGSASCTELFKRWYEAIANDAERLHPVTVATSTHNRLLNRFANIVAYDDSRVILAAIDGQPTCQNDYINASFIDGYSIQHKYIAAQGPMSKTLVDFWRLVWQQRCPTIVMVTNLKERNRSKCEQYWPDSGSQNFGPFRVSISNQQILSDYTVRALQVELTEAFSPPFSVIQFHFTSWPDHGVPEHTSALLGMYHRLKAVHDPMVGPMLVHCSAGVGRTGTLIAIDFVLDKMERDFVVDIAGTVAHMRHQRMKMVSTSDQFVFVCKTILELVACGNTEIDAGYFQGEISKLSAIDTDTGKSGFENQFDVLNQVSPNPSTVKCDVALTFPDKNRSMDYLPSDKHRVLLKENMDYINATFVNAHKQKKAFIVAQNPLRSTCRDFWKMVVDRDCGVIVMLGTTEEDGHEVCAQYWPVSDVHVACFGEFCIELLEGVNHQNYIERKLLISYESGKSLMVTQYQILNWNSSGQCYDSESIISVLEKMYIIQRRTGNNPIVVHCSDTLSRSGMFCAIADIVDRLKTEAVVDVFQVVKSQRMQKPGMVLTVDQYQFIFEVVLAFVTSFEDYSNF